MNKRRTFTLLEIVVATAILGLGLCSVMVLSGSAQERVVKSIDRWYAQHMFAQAAEFFLTEGPNANIGQEFFPYKGYRATCEIVEPEGLPADFDMEFDDWKLVTMVITITDSRGNLVRSGKIDKIINKKLLE